MDSTFPIIYTKLPDSLEISTNEYGNCLIAREYIPARSTIYHESIPLIEESELATNYKLIVVNRPHVEPMILDPNVHFVRIGSRRQRYGFESFTNHSCDPNTQPVNWQVFEDRIEFDTIALKDIQIGDEICCNYALFDYDCHGHEITSCQCGSNKCAGKMMGYHHLPQSEKENLSQFVLPLLLEYEQK